MDEEIDRLVIGVRADTQGFARDVAAMRDMLDGPFGKGAERAGHTLEAALSRAMRTGKLGFEDLRHIALSALSDIAAAALRSGVSAALGSGGSGASKSLITLGTTALSALLGLPGRAIGGPVAPGRGYVVGERGPEVFVPTAAGTILPSSASGARDVRVSITVQGPAATAPNMLAQSSRQVARAVRTALLSDI